MLADIVVVFVTWLKMHRHVKECTKLRFAETLSTVLLVDGTFLHWAARMAGITHFDQAVSILCGCLTHLCTVCWELTFPRAQAILHISAIIHLMLVDYVRQSAVLVRLV